MSYTNQYGRLASGDVLSFTIEGEDHYINADTDIDAICRYIDLNHTSPSFRIYVLYPDETINYEIPNSVIKSGGNYSENYQDGQRRSLSFTIYNEDGKYSPDINNLWAGTRLRLDIGIAQGNVTVWFHKGIFVINKITPSLAPGSREVAITAGDKFGLFENTTGRLETSYNIDTDLDIEEIIQTIQKTSLGDDTIFDPKPLIYHHQFKGKKTQAAISKSAGDNYGSILTELATQLSAEIFYNSEGNLTLIPTQDTSEDSNKPIVYHYNADDGGFSQLSFDYDYNSIVNRIVVIGSSDSGSVNEATAINNDERSPFCYQRIGYRTGNIINDSNITSETLAKERAEYELRQQLILKTSSSTEVAFNPFLGVNNIIAVDSDFYDLSNSKYLIQNLSFSLDYSNKMNISFTNVMNISTDIGSIRVITPSSRINSDKAAVAPSAVHQYRVTYKGHGDGILEVYLGSKPETLPGDSDATVITDTTSKHYFDEGTIVYLHVVINSTYYRVPSNFTNWTKLSYEKTVDGVRQWAYWIKVRGEIYSILDGGILVYAYNQANPVILLKEISGLELPQDIKYKFIIPTDSHIANLTYQNSSQTITINNGDTVNLTSMTTYTFTGVPVANYYTKGLGEKIDYYNTTPNLVVGDQTITWGTARRCVSTINVPVDWGTFASITIKYYQVDATTGQMISTQKEKTFTSGTVKIEDAAQGSDYTVSGIKKNVSYVDFGAETVTITGSVANFQPTDTNYWKNNQLTAKDADVEYIKIYTGVGVLTYHLEYTAGYSDSKNRGSVVKIDGNAITSGDSDDNGHYIKYQKVKGTDVLYEFAADTANNYSIYSGGKGSGNLSGNIGTSCFTKGKHNRGSGSFTATLTNTTSGFWLWKTSKVSGNFTIPTISTEDAWIDGSIVFTDVGDSVDVLTINLTTDKTAKEIIAGTQTIYHVESVASLQYYYKGTLTITATSQAEYTLDADNSSYSRYYIDTAQTTQYAFYAYNNLSVKGTLNAMYQIFATYEKR